MTRARAYKMRAVLLALLLLTAQWPCLAQSGDGSGTESAGNPWDYIGS
jgi:hypothetical protein